VIVSRNRSENQPARTAITFWRTTRFLPGIAGAPPAVGVEESAPTGLTRSSSGRPRLDSRDVGGESIVGCTENPRRAHEARHRRQPSDGREVHCTRRRRPPSQTWRTFLANHVDQIVAADFASSRPSHIACYSSWSSSPTNVAASFTSGSPRSRPALWTAEQLREAFPEYAAPRYLVHDRDHAFATLVATASGMGIQEIRTAPRSTWQNPYAGRVIGSIRRECLDHVMVVNATGLARVLSRYIALLPPIADESFIGERLATVPGRSRHPRSTRSSPRHRSAAYTIATTAGRRSHSSLI
jgi:hypothetical protein